MEIRTIKKEALSPELVDFIYGSLLDLWVIEEPHLLPQLRNDLGNADEASVFAFSSLDKLFVAFVDEVPVGFLGVATGFPYHVDKMFVIPSHRRSGVGSCLMNAFQMTVENKIVVLVSPGNTKAVDFYQGCGFDTRSVEYLYKEEYPLIAVVGTRNYQGV